MRSFRLRVLPMLSLLLLGALPTIATYNVLAVLRERSFAAAMLDSLAVALLVLPILGLLAWFFSYLFAVRIGTAGLRSWTAIGWPRTIAWLAVEQACPTDWMGFSYVRVYSRDGGSPIWVPMWLKDPRGFAEVVLACAGQAHPVTQALSPIRHASRPAPPTAEQLRSPDSSDR